MKSTHAVNVVHKLVIWFTAFFFKHCNINFIAIKLRNLNKI